MSSTSSSRPNEAPMSEPLPCPECGEMKLVRVSETCQVAEGPTVPRLRHHKCGACGARFFDDAAMHAIQRAREKNAEAASLR